MVGNPESTPCLLYPSFCCLSVSLSLLFSSRHMHTHHSNHPHPFSFSLIFFFLFGRGCVGPANNAPKMWSRVQYPRLLSWFLFHWLCDRGSLLSSLRLSSWRWGVRKAWKIDKTVFSSNPNMCSGTPVWCLLLTWSCSICVFPSSTEDRILGLGHLGQVC